MCPHFGLPFLAGKKSIFPSGKFKLPLLSRRARRGADIVWSGSFLYHCQSGLHSHMTLPKHSHRIIVGEILFLKLSPHFCNLEKQDISEYYFNNNNLETISMNTK